MLVTAVIDNCAGEEKKATRGLSTKQWLYNHADLSPLEVLWRPTCCQAVPDRCSHDERYNPPGSTVHHCSFLMAARLDLPELNQNSSHFCCAGWYFTDSNNQSCWVVRLGLTLVQCSVCCQAGSRQHTYAARLGLTTHHPVGAPCSCAVQLHHLFKLSGRMRSIMGEMLPMLLCLSALTAQCMLERWTTPLHMKKREHHSRVQAV